MKMVVAFLCYNNELLAMSTQKEKTDEYWLFDQKCRNLLQDDAKRQKMYMELALRVSMRKDFDYSLGPVKYSASRRQNAVMISFPINSNILLVSVEPTMNIDEFANKIMKIIGLQ